MQLSTNPPPRLVTDWEDIWEDEPTLPPIVTQAPRRKHGAKPEPVVKPAPQPCQYHNAVFAPGRHVLAVIECLGPEVPSSAIYRIPLEVNQQKPLEPIFHMQNNTLLRQRAALVAFPQVKSFPVMISGGYHAQVRLFLPPGLREDEITRYPLVLHVYVSNVFFYRFFLLAPHFILRTFFFFNKSHRYSGPGSQLVTQQWRVDWNTYLAGTKDYIVAQIDGRGSSGQGYRLLHEVYRRLGTVEVSDQLEVSEYLRDNLHFIDKRRVGIWGWSYGGYTAAMALANQMSLFHCGASVAPVVNWKLYGMNTELLITI